VTYASTLANTSTGLVVPKNAKTIRPYAPIYSVPEITAVEFANARPGKNNRYHLKSITKMETQATTRNPTSI
jgi:hypothetical protein